MDRDLGCYPSPSLLDLFFLFRFGMLCAHPSSSKEGGGIPDNITSLDIRPSGGGAGETSRCLDILGNKHSLDRIWKITVADISVRTAYTELWRIIGNIVLGELVIP